MCELHQGPRENWTRRRMINCTQKLAKKFHIQIKDVLYLGVKGEENQGEENQGEPVLNFVKNLSVPDGLGGIN